MRGLFGGRVIESSSHETWNVETTIAISLEIIRHILHFPAPISAFKYSRYIKMSDVIEDMNTENI